MQSSFDNIDEQAIVEAVMSRWNHLVDERRPKLWMMQECRLAWERKFGSTWGEIEDGRSHRFIPEAFQAVEQAVSKYLEGVMPSSRYFTLQARKPDSEKACAPMEAKLRWDNYRMNHADTFELFLKRACVDGNVPWTYNWYTERSVIRDESLEQARQEMTAMGMEVEVNDPAGLGYATQELTTFQGGRMVVGDIFNYYQDRQPDDPRFAFRVYRTHQAVEYIRAKWGSLKDENGKPVYKNLDLLEDESIYRDTSDSYKKELETAEGYMPLQKERVELLTFSGDFWIKGTGYYHNIFGILANRRHLLRFCVNPHAHGLPPWQLFTLIPNPSDPYGLGTGIIEPCLGLFDGVNVRVNQVFDANAIAVSPPINVVQNSVTSAHQLVWGPGEQNWVRDQNDIRTMMVPENALNLSANEISFFKQEISATSGSMMLGSSDSASEFQGVQSQANAVMSRMIKRISRAMADQLRMHMALNQQCMSPDNPITMKVLIGQNGGFTNMATGEVLAPGEAWVTMSGQDIQGEFDVEVQTAPDVALNQNQIQQKNQLFQQISQDPVMQEYLNKPEFYREELSWFKFPDSHRFIKTDQEVALARQQQVSNPPMGNNGGPGSPNGATPKTGGGGVASTPGNAGGGGSAARAPYPQQLVGPTRNAGR